jgi:hypothetical protein
LIFGFVGVRKFDKHLLELFKVDISIPVDVNFCNDSCPDLVVSASVVTENRCNLGGFNGATFVFIKEVEGCAQVRLVQQLVLLN